jgi:hypothetical protein
VEQSGLPVWRAAWAFAEFQAGGRDAAREVLAAMAGPEIALPRDSSWLAALSLLAEICAGLGARVEAERVHRALLPHAGVQVVAGVGMLHLGPVTRFLGQTATVIGDHHAAERFLDRALADDRRLGARSSELRTRLARVEPLRSRRAGPAAVRAERRRARELAAHSGLEGELEVEHGRSTAARIGRRTPRVRQPPI